MTTESARHFILGTAGHVDHGKSALIKALTGVETDRLKEERDRGISIELGFAELPLDDGTVLGVVDVPGHERFVKQMVAGSGGVDLALLVVAADESVMPQTVEHLAILDTLGVSGGVVVMTKIDLVDEELLAVASEEAAELVAGTFLEGKPIVPVSAVAGTGLEALQATLRTEVEALPERSLAGPFRLPIDRIFSLPGVGVIVTGTCWRGAVHSGDHLQIEPLGRKVRVREVQVHGRVSEVGGSGQRLALALHGVKKEDLSRGFQAISNDSCTVGRRVDLRIELLPHYRGLVKNRQRVHVNHAGREVLGRVVLLDEQQLSGETGPRTCLAQLHLEDDLIMQTGDRLVLRFYSPVTSIAGGVILNPGARPHKRFDQKVLKMLAIREKGDPLEVFRQNVKTAGLAGLALVDADGPADDEAVVRVGERLFHRQLLMDLATRIGALITAYAQRFPLRLGIPKEETRRKCKFPGGPNEWNALCQVLSQLGGWVVVGDRIAASTAGPPLDDGLTAAVQRREGLLREYGLSWPGLEAFSAAAGPGAPDTREEDYLRYLVDRGRAHQINSDFYLHAETLTDLVQRLRTYFGGEADLQFGTFRELCGLTRKLGIPLLEFLDQQGLTTRVGDVRQAGPALGKAAQQ